MLHLYSGYAIFLQHFRRYLYGSYLLCDPEFDDWKSKRKEDQRINVCTYGIIHIEICLSVKYNRKRRTKRDRSFRSLFWPVRHFTGTADGKIRKAYEGELKYEFTYDGAYYEGLY